jgi:hypothetical protein
VQLVLDWDGTVTERDTLDLVLERFGDAEVYECAEAELEAGRMTLNEVISAEFAVVTAPLDEVVAHVLEHARVRPGFAELARKRGPLIVSSGFHELIEPLLEREGVLDAVELRANRSTRGPTAGASTIASGTRAASAASPVSAPTCPTGRSSTPATATRTTALRSRPTASSPRAGSRGGSSGAASRSRR